MRPSAEKCATGMNTSTTICSVPVSPSANTFDQLPGRSLPSPSSPFEDSVTEPGPPCRYISSVPTCWHAR